ncbi:antibiotic biosynthesis monooxygenase [Streptomyces sp. NPDC004232]|uniref:antibiotic biosynthesis monooxygenase family protein n=1 Tax=Streptomyces sp. NPDC004232 TaxID=3154454 RepID=UPI0033A615A0
MAAALYRVSLRMAIQPGKEKEFEEAWLTGAARIADAPGNVGQELSQGEGDGAYYVVSDWESKEAFAAYECSPGHQEHRRSLAPYRTRGEMVTMRTLYRMDAEGRARKKSSVRVLLHLRVASGQEDRVENLYHRVSDELDGTPGLLRNELLQGLAAPQEWAVLSEWRDADAFREWENGADHRGTTAPLRPFQNQEAGSVFGVYEVRAEH